MINLGTIDITNQNSINEARKKILRVTESLTADPIVAARLATATSEMCRSLARGAIEPHIGLEIHDSVQPPTLALTFEDQQPLPSTNLLDRFFDEVERLPSSNGQHAVRAIKRLPDGLQLEESDIDHLKAVIGRKSRDELMDELRKTLEGLEQRVAERTADLAKANERIRSSEERLKFALEGSNCLLYTSDAADDK